MAPVAFSFQREIKDLRRGLFYYIIVMFKSHFCRNIHLGIKASLLSFMSSQIDNFFVLKHKVFNGFLCLIFDFFYHSGLCLVLKKFHNFI